MTDWTPENNRIQTMHLTADELAALKAAKWGWEFWCGDYWSASTGPRWDCVELVYRAKPAPVTQDVVPWEAIAPMWNWCARDENAWVYVFRSKPALNNSYWDSAEGARVEELLSGYTPGTCDWRDSLQQRPQPAATGAVPPKYGERYWFVDLSEETWVFRGRWHDHPVDHLRFSRGFVFLTEAAAVAHAKRMTGGV